MAQEFAVDAEVLRQNLVWRVLEPVTEQKRAVFVESAIIEDQEELASVGTEALNGVRYA